MDFGTKWLYFHRFQAERFSCVAIRTDFQEQFQWKYTRKADNFGKTRC